jgi:outer membrane biosynthesis protein TonB
MLAALGDALTAILGCAGLLAGVWFMARGSRAGGGLSIAPSATPTAAAVPEAEPAEAPDPTAFRHGAIRLVGEPATAPAPPASASAAVPPAPPASALAAVPPAPELAVEPEPEPEPEPEHEPEPQPEPPPPPPAYLPPPIPPAPRTSFRQGPIRLGGIEHGRTTRGPSDEPPDAA